MSEKIEKILLKNEFNNVFLLLKKTKKYAPYFQKPNQLISKVKM